MNCVDIIFLTYAVGFIGVWLYAGFMDELNDEDVCIGFGFVSMFWPAVAAAGAVYLFFKGLVWLGRSLQYLPKAYTWLLIKYYRWRHGVS